MLFGCPHLTTSKICCFQVTSILLWYRRKASLSCTCPMGCATKCHTSTCSKTPSKFTASLQGMGARVCRKMVEACPCMLLYTARASVALPQVCMRHVDLWTVTGPGSDCQGFARNYSTASLCAIDSVLRSICQPALDASQTGARSTRVNCSPDTVRLRTICICAL